jgi:2-phosphosulfolactate phosphatase
MNFEVLFTPAEFATLPQRDLSATACVVFDVLRATSTFVTALHHGAKAIIPVSEIPQAIALRKNQPDVLLGGERHGVRISADGIDFDLGNSPREYLREVVRGKTIVSTTSNGTRALRACMHAPVVLAASFLNLTATAEFLRQKDFENILLICAGTGEHTALEDVLGAGALCELLVTMAPSDSVQIARRTWREAKSNLAEVISSSENARRLLEIPGLRADLAFCLQHDACPVIAKMEADGAIRISV